jgi:hypothetical protein
VNITEKLTRLAEGKRKADIARSAGLMPTQFNDYTVKGSKPRYDIALRLAKALSVSPEWLFDDRQEWPPPASEGRLSASSLSDRELMLEVAARNRRSVLNLLEALDDAEKIDWALAKSKPPSEIGRIIYPIFYWVQLLASFSPAVAAAENHATMPGALRERKDFDLVKIAERVSRLLENPEFQLATVGCQMLISKEEEADLKRLLGLPVQTPNKPPSNAPPPPKNVHKKK